jgi:hypothetical protein
MLRYLWAMLMLALFPIPVLAAMDPGTPDTNRCEFTVNVPAVHARYGVQWVRDYDRPDGVTVHVWLDNQGREFRTVDYMDGRSCIVIDKDA